MKKIEKIKKERDNYKEFYDQVKRKIRDSGRTNVISVSDIDDLIIKFHPEEEDEWRI